VGSNNSRGLREWTRPEDGSGVIKKIALLVTEWTSSGISKQNIEEEGQREMEPYRRNLQGEEKEGYAE